jgi:hypothetical protein
VVLLLILSQIFSVYIFKDEPYLLDFLALYKESFSIAFSNLFTDVGALEIEIFSIFAFLYFFMETLFGVSLGRVIANKKVVFVKVPDSYVKLTKSILRGAVKVIPFVPLILLFTIAKYPKYSQTIIDKKLGLIVISTKGEPGRISFQERLKALTVSSIIIYYSTLLGSVLMLLSTVPSTTLGGSGNGLTNNITFLQAFYIILNNNVAIDVRNVILGLGAGVALLINVTLENILQGVLIVVVEKSLGSHALLTGILPQFFPETLGFSLGIASSFSLTYMEIDSLEVLVRGTSGTEYHSSLKIDVLILLATLIGSVILLVLGALIEASL